MGQLTVDLSAIMNTPEMLKTKEQRLNRKGVAFPRHFTARQEAGKTPYDEVQWETRTASIGNDKGAVIFEQRDIEVPVDWSQTATNIVASKYFHGKLGSPDRETSVAPLVQRVVYRKGVPSPRHFTARQEAGKTPYDEVQWETRTASIGNDKGAVIFEQRDIEVPVDWSQTATNI